MRAASLVPFLVPQLVLLLATVLVTFPVAEFERRLELDRLTPVEDPDRGQECGRTWSFPCLEDGNEIETRRAPVHERPCER